MHSGDSDSPNVASAHRTQSTFSLFIRDAHRGISPSHAATKLAGGGCPVFAHDQRHCGPEIPYEATISGRSRKASEAKLKGIEVFVSGLEARDPGRRRSPGEKVKSSRNGVHHADAVVWGPV
eukprot:8076-Pelagococcus_subviridis.AAC.2